MSLYKIRVRRGRCSGEWYAAPGMGTVTEEKHAYLWDLKQIQVNWCIVKELRNRTLILKLVPDE